MAADGLDQIRATLDWLIELNFQYLARLLLHGVAMLGGADAQLALGSFGQLPDGNASHAINDITAINDCKRCRS